MATNWKKLVPKIKWGQRRQSITLLFTHIRVQAMDRYADEETERSGVPVNRSMIANDLVNGNTHPRIRELETIIKQEKRDARLASRQSGRNKKAERVE